jgi:hypothetical protein
MMASVRESLIAARALIDTTEKWEANNRRVGGGDDVFLAMSEAYDKSGFRKRFQMSVAYVLFCIEGSTTHDDIMALFDRAIAAKEPHNG